MTRSSGRRPLGRTALAVAVGAVCALTGCATGSHDIESDDGRSGRTVQPARTAVLMGDTVLVNHPDGQDQAMPTLGGVREVAPSARRAGPAAAGAVHREAEDRRCGWTCRTRPGPTTRRGAVPGAAGQAGLRGHPLAVTAVVNEASRVPGDHAVDDPRAGASDGRKWVAVLAEVSNAGARPYGYGVSRSFTAVDTRGRRHTPLPVPADLTVGPVMTWPVPLGAGRSARGWLVFELPAEAALATLEFGRTRTSAAADWTL